MTNIHGVATVLGAAGAHTSRIGGSSGANRVVVSDIAPQVDAGEVAVKTIVGEPVRVSAEIFADGHDVLTGALRYRSVREDSWREVPMRQVADDLHEASFTPTEPGAYRFQVAARIDDFESWRHAFPRRSGEDAELNLRIGARLVQQAAARASGADATKLRTFGDVLEAGGPRGTKAAGDERLAQLVARHPDRARETTSSEFPVQVNRERARFGAWYSVFPRSLGAAEAGATPTHGTLRDVIDDLDRIKGMGYDVVYLPPIHPIGSTFRKGANNAEVAVPGEPGVPYAIGSADGGHTSIHPQLGDMADFDALVAAARERDMEIGMDVAFQASPDHPWVAEHPTWFRQRPDGTVQYAENPPKKYQDVYPFDFESDDWPQLWDGLTGVVKHWADHGVRAFRVDNPHTKPFAFWQHLIGEIKAEHPDSVFLSEAFARPNIQDTLGKAGFDQTYTYFPWKTTPAELRKLGEHYAADGRPLYMTPSHWPTTHDILPENLQGAGRGQFASRAILAGTMSPTYGTFGPAFETMENVALEAGSIEFRNSEKYQLRSFARDGNDLSPVLERLNSARRSTPALRSAEPPQFLKADNPGLAAFTRSSVDGKDHVVVVANTGRDEAGQGTVKLPLARLGIGRDEDYVLTDLMDGTSYPMRGADLYVELDMARQPAPAHIFQVHRAAD